MNNVNVIGRLVRDPELRHTPGGTEVCGMRIAVDGAGSKQDDGSYGAGFFDITCWGKLAVSCDKYLEKGKKVGVSGRLSFSEWEAQDGGGKRSKVEITAGQVDFLTPAGENGGGSSSSGGSAPAAAADDDIPF